MLFGLFEGDGRAEAKICQMECLGGAGKVDGLLAILAMPQGFRPPSGGSQCAPPAEDRSRVAAWSPRRYFVRKLERNNIIPLPAHRSLTYYGLLTYT